MKNNKSLFYAVLSLLSITSLIACGGNPNNRSNNSSGEGDYEPDIDEERELEIGDTVKEWVSRDDYSVLPLDVPEGGTGTREIVNNFGHEDQESLHFSVKSNSGYLTTEVSKPYFSEFDAKNGDIISLYVFVPANSNLESLELELNSISNGDTIKGTKLQVTEEKQEKWIRLEGSYDTLNNLRSIRVNFVPVDSNQEVEFYVDNINITLGEETVQTGYEYKDESLCKTYEDHFIVGNILSRDTLQNSEYRRIIKDNFNSITCENEAKPQSVLDQSASQALVTKTGDERQVAITVDQFEKIYDWCEASHIKVRHHTFVWHQQTPEWFFKKGYSNNGEYVSKQIMLGRLDNFFKVMINTLDERWPELVYALDVVNEAIEEVGQIRQSGHWKDIIGEDFIYQAFVAANRHRLDYMDLYYNDYAFDQEEWGGVERCRWACGTLLRDAIDEGLIDGIGIQSHIDKPEYADAVIEDAKIIHAAGLKCQITELDIACGGQSDFENQKQLFRKIVGNVLEGNENGTMDVNAIIVWGITDNKSWHSNTSPLMFNADFSKKPAYYGFLDTLDEYLNGATFSEDSSSD